MGPKKVRRLSVYIDEGVMKYIFRIFYWLVFGPEEEINQVNDKGEMHGVWRTYNNNGQLYHEVSYVNGIRHGKCILWNTNDESALSYESTFVNGKQEGISRSYWANGKLMSEVNYVKGKRHGINRAWNVDGSAWLITNYVDNNAEGEVIEYKYEFNF